MASLKSKLSQPQEPKKSSSIIEEIKATSIAKIEEIKQVEQVEEAQEMNGVEVIVYETLEPYQYCTFCDVIGCRHGPQAIVMLPPRNWHGFKRQQALSTIG